MMDKKQDILKRMQFELDYADKCNVEPVAGESYMTVQYVYHKLKESFENTFIPDHILEILDEQGFPLGDYYDYYIDQGYLQKDVDWSQITREYVMYKECEFVEEQLHEKVQAEYKEFMTKVVDMAPLKVGKMLTEIALKMQAFSIFRYQDCFSMDDMKLLQGVDHLLERMYVKHDGANIPKDDEHVIWAKTMEYLGEVVKDERGEDFVEDEVMEA
jgi:hypothetical protein